MLEVLRRHASTLDIVRAQLDQYLELKRTQFPRFYFLSNDELIEILATAGVDPRAVQVRVFIIDGAIAHIYFVDFYIVVAALVDPFRCGCSPSF